MRSFLDRKNSNASYRTEVEGLGRHEIGNEYWIGISIRVSDDWVPGLTREALFQIHDTPKDWSNGRNPIAFLEAMEAAQGGEWRFSNLWLPVYNGTISDQKVVVRKTLGRIVPGQWVDWVFNWRWDWRESGTGRTRVWKQGQLVVDYAGPNCYNDDAGPYVKFGIYKWDWKNRELADPVATRLVYHDEYREAGAGGSYALVAPRGAVAPNPPDLSVT
jgi:hypothetical protein